MKISIWTNFNQVPSYLPNIVHSYKGYSNKPDNIPGSRVGIEEQTDVQTQLNGLQELCA